MKIRTRFRRGSGILLEVHEWERFRPHNGVLYETAECLHYYDSFYLRPESCPPYFLPPIAFGVPSLLEPSWYSRPYSFRVDVSDPATIVLTTSAEQFQMDIFTIDRKSFLVRRYVRGRLLYPGSPRIDEVVVDIDSIDVDREVRPQEVKFRRPFIDSAPKSILFNYLSILMLVALASWAWLSLRRRDPDAQADAASGRRAWRRLLIAGAVLYGIVGLLFVISFLPGASEGHPPFIIVPIIGTIVVTELLLPFVVWLAVRDIVLRRDFRRPRRG